MLDFDGAYSVLKQMPDFIFHYGKWFEGSHRDESALEMITAARSHAETTENMEVVVPGRCGGHGCRSCRTYCCLGRRTRVKNGGPTGDCCPLVGTIVINADLRHWCFVCNSWNRPRCSTGDFGGAPMGMTGVQSGSSLEQQQRLTFLKFKVKHERQSSNQDKRLQIVSLCNGFIRTH